MEHKLNLNNDLSRRSFIEKMAWGTFGVSILHTPTLGETTPIVPVSTKKLGKAKHVIYIYLNGGASHTDTFDPKTDPLINTGVDAVTTKAGFQIAGYYPELAKFGDKFSVIRGMNSKTGAHAQGQYLMRTSYAKNGLTVHPAMGAISSWQLGKQHASIPDNILITGDTDHPREGYLDKKFTPLPIVNPNEGLRFSKASVADTTLNNRLNILNAIDKDFRSKYGIKDVSSYNELYDETMKLLKSEDLAVFDLGKEDPVVRDRYGRNNFGQGLLLAKRLISSGVRFVEVDNGGWDMHNDIKTNMTRKAQEVDVALSNLFADLQSSGLLDKTLIVVATEFGRTPKINQNEGKDHFPAAFSCMLGGLDIGGKVIGQTNEDASKVIERPTTIGELNSTIGHLLGIPHNKVYHSPTFRPFTTGNNAEPIKELI